MIKPDPVITDSRAIPVAIKRYVLWREGGFCVCGCGEVGKDFDHSPAWNLLDPKGHDPDKIFLRGKNCHRIKSGRDTTTAAKVKRVAAKHKGDRKRPKKQIQSRGFDKTLIKKLNGKVVMKTKGISND